MTQLWWEVIHMIVWEAVTCIAAYLAWHLLIGADHDVALVWVLIFGVAAASWRTGLWHRRLDEARGEDA